LLAFAAATPAAAWHQAGHIVVAQIAHDRLTPETRAEADRLIGVLADFAPVRADFVSASVWLDEIKEEGWNAFDTWHFVNLPYNAGGLRSIPTGPDESALEALDHAVATLRDGRAGDLARAFSLRVVIHVVADLHQPMHCVNRFTHEHPEGDRGGNDFLLGDTNLHLYWDEAGGLLGELDASSPSTEVAAAVAGLLDAVPEEALTTVDDLDSASWAREGHGLAVSVAYVGLVEGREPSESYRIRTQLVTQRRLVTAGYRLAALLEKALAPAP
ncbi:MAG: S1/P1 nuclease, partial [Acidobacteriota bacterium]